jgi:hypothetical protein
MGVAIAAIELFVVRASMAKRPFQWEPVRRKVPPGRLFTTGCRRFALQRCAI